jgi:hypothetical protein
MMAKEKLFRSLTEEQRKRILEAPGVVVQKRASKPGRPFFVPRIQVQRKLDITADELINAEDDEELLW